MQTQASRGGPSRKIAQAAPSLSSAENFRDLAGNDGYVTADGRMRCGVFFRSNRLDLSIPDRIVLEQLRVSAIHDLRESREVVSVPDVEISGATWRHHPVTGIPTAVVRELHSEEQTVLAMNDVYRRFVSDPVCRHGFSNLPHALLEDEGPQVIHCSAGKDRTGWAAVLLHHIAAIDRRTLEADYLLTDELSMASRAAATESLTARFGAARSPAWGPALRCDLAYLLSGFREVDLTFGSLDGYLSEGLGLSRADRSELHRRLVATD